MKQIQPVQIWVNGQEQTGNYINAHIINDNLESFATFYWAIYNNHSNVLLLSAGNLTISEPDYSVWDDTADINLAAYEWICSQLGLTLI